MTNHQQLIITWTSLKTKLSKLLFLNQHKELLKDALATHLNQSSSFTSSNSSEYSPAMVSYWTKEKELINRKLAELERSSLPTEAKETRTKKLKEHLEQANQMLERANLEIQAFARQKERNQAIVEECKEVLEKLT